MKDFVYISMLHSNTLSNEQKQKETEYKNYVDDHIARVINAWKNMKSRPDMMKIITDMNNGSDISKELDIQIESHDLSKYGIDEWEAYRRHFYNVDEQEKWDSQQDFDYAWSHHKLFNPHHWEHWAEMDKKNEMPLNFVIEMACDWIAMSETHKGDGDAYHWFINRKDIDLGDKQFGQVKQILTTYYNIKE